MIVEDIPKRELRELLKRDGLCLDILPFVVRINSDVASLADDLALAYADFPVLEAQGFADFHVSVTYAGISKYPFQRQARFCFDGRELFTRLPAYQAFTMLEWGLNWCIAAHCNEFLTIHAAVVERNGYAIVLPAPPGSGKSTLCTGLISRGWRLLSDELALLNMDSGMIFGMSRPINLKNEAIQVIQSFAPDLAITRPVKNTSKGTVALVQPPASSVARRKEPAAPGWVIYPRYVPGAMSSLTQRSKASTFMHIAEQSFNYDTLHRKGFLALGTMIGQCDCFDFEYSNLDDAIQCFDQLTNKKNAPLPVD